MNKFSGEVCILCLSIVASVGQLRGKSLSAQEWDDFHRGRRTAAGIGLIFAPLAWVLAAYLNHL
jgi:hypothetical protein